MENDFGHGLFFKPLRYLPNTPFHGGITTDTAPCVCAWQASRINGVGSEVSMLPISLIFFPSRAATSDNFSAPPSTPTQHVPHEAERHSTGIGPSTRRGSISRQLRERSSAAPQARS